MAPRLALTLTLAFIALLLVRDHRDHPELSLALWLPLLWLFLAGSKNLSDWISLNAGRVTTIESYSEGNSLDRNFTLLLMFLGALVVARRKTGWRELLRANQTIVFFLLYCLLSVLWSDYPFIAFRRWVKFLAIFPMILVVASERSQAEAVAALLRRCSYLLVPLSLLFVRYYPQYGRYYNVWTLEVGYAGVAGNKNELGMLCFVAVTVLAWDLLSGRRRQERLFSSPSTWLKLIVLGMAVYLLRIAHSATATLCVVVSLLVLLLTRLPSMRNSPRQVAAKVVGLGALAAVFQLLFDVKDAVIRALGRNPTLTDRTTLWATVLGMGTHPLLGTGYESFWTENRLESLWSTGLVALQSHNGYLDTYLTLGVIGLLFLGALFFAGFRQISRDMGTRFAFNQLKLAFLVTYGLYNYTEAAFPRTSYLLFIFFLLLTVLPQRAEQPMAVQELRFSP